MVTLGNEELKHITMFEQLTGTVVKDCVIGEDGVIFAVKEGEIGRAIGRGGSTLERVRRAFGKEVEVVEHSDSLEKFVEHLLYPARVKSVDVREEKGEKVAVVQVDSSSRGSAIGRGGKKIKLAKMLLMRHHNMGIKLL